MATIRTRFWRTKQGTRTAVIVDYVDADGRRRLQTFRGSVAAHAFKEAIEAGSTVELRPISASLPSAVMADDVLWGCQAIANFIKRRRSATFHMLQAGTIPAKKIGAQWVSSRSKLTAFLTP